MRYEIKIRTKKRLVDRVKMLASEYGISINETAIHLLELGIYQILKEEEEYGKNRFKKINSK